jgi:hypothetical protein
LGNITDSIDDSNINLCSTSAANLPKDTEIVFIPDISRHRYRPTDITQKKFIEIEPIKDPSKDSLQFKQSFEKTQRVFLNIIESLYAGCLIGTLILLPSDSSKFSLLSTVPKIDGRGLNNPDDDFYGFYFIASYSEFALNLSFLVQILSSVNLFQRLDSVYQHYEFYHLKVVLGSSRLKALSSILALICNFI